MSAEEKNKAVVRRFLEAHSKGDLDGLEVMLASDFVNHNLLPDQGPDRGDYMRAFAEYHAAFSVARYVIEKQLEAERHKARRLKHRVAIEDSRTGRSSETTS